MLEAILFLLFGLVVLLAAGESLVRGASSIAALAKVPPLIVGLTIVAFGTSAPELVVTINAVTAGAPGIALGNIVGSNIANVLLVMGLPAILTSIPLAVPRLRRHATALLIATTVFCGMVYWNGKVGLPEALVFTGGMLFYFALMVAEARGGHGEESSDEDEKKPSLPGTIALTVAGLIGLPLGATLLVDNGGELARLMGVREEIIGLTVVAFGTSLPELATVLAAAVRKDASVSAGTIIGSNIFNLLFVGSAAGYAGTSAFTSAALRVDIPMMIAATLLVTGLIFAKRDFGRLLGIGSVIVYLTYIIFIGSGAG